MKYVLPALVITVIVITGCRNKKIENETIQDSVATTADTTTAKAAALAFSPIETFTLKKDAVLPDSLNFLVLAGADEFNNLFEGAGTAPDFVINYTIAIVRQSAGGASLEVNRVELKESTLSVFAVYTDSDPTRKSSEAKIYAIERRDGVISIDFYVNGKPASKMMMPGI